MTTTAEPATTADPTDPTDVVYCAPLAGYPGAYRVRAVDAEPFGPAEGVMQQTGTGWSVMWGAASYGFAQNREIPGGLLDIVAAARAAVDIIGAGQ